LISGIIDIRNQETPPSAEAHLHLKGQAQNGAFLQTIKKWQLYHAV